VLPFSAMGLLDAFKRKKDGPDGPNGRDAEVERLIAELKSPDRAVREAAAARLGQLGTRAAAAQQALEEATCDDDGDVCLAAADSLSVIRRALDRR
jgi:HEAT repeat protein